LPASAATCSSEPWWTPEWTRRFFTKPSLHYISTRRFASKRFHPRGRGYGCRGAGVHSWGHLLPRSSRITLRQSPAAVAKGHIAIPTAGTSDQPFAEEAAVPAELFSVTVSRVYDVGVAGLHRLLAQREVLSQADVVIVCAGMEGALPSVVGGLVGVPVIAVPTSVGYGASFDGVAALLGMLNSCSPNVTVVNIDNGFGAAYTAVLIARASNRGS
jgi:NCAIR mutase (PurE)-related protein